MKRRPACHDLRRPLVEELEPRILLSADVDPGLMDLSLGDPGDAPAAEVMLLEEEATSAVRDVIRREIVFVDAGVEDHEQLVEMLDARPGDARAFEVFVLDAERDGVEQMSAVLGRYEDLAAVHVVSHGTEGAVQLGDSWLSAATLEARAEEIVLWGDALALDADLLFYGCDLAAGEGGTAFVESLSRLTGADVAASVDTTGPARLGADWQLEYAVGVIETPVAPGSEIQESWSTRLCLTTIGDGVSPADSSVWTSGRNNAVDAFTLSTDAGADTLTGLDFAFSGTDANDVAAAGVKLWRDDGSTVNEWDPTDTFLSTASLVGTTASFTGLAEAIDATATQYLVTYDIAAAATPGDTLQGAVSAATVGYALCNDDTADATLTVLPDGVHETSVYKATFSPGLLEELYLKESSSPTTNTLQGMSLGSVYSGSPGSLLMSWDPDATLTTLLDNATVERVQMSGRLISSAGDSYGTAATTISFYEDRALFDLAVTLSTNPGGTDWMFMTYGQWDDALLDETFQWTSSDSGSYSLEDPAPNFNTGNQTAPISYQSLFELGATDGLVNATLQDISGFSPSQLKNTDADTGGVDIAFQRIAATGPTYRSAVMYSFDTTTGGFDTTLTEERQDGFITPAVLNFGVAGGDGALVGDGFAEGGGAYTLDDADADDHVKFEFQVGAVTPHKAPIFEIGAWDAATPALVRVDGVVQVAGTDYNAAVEGGTLYLQYLNDVTANAVFEVGVDQSPVVGDQGFAVAENSADGTVVGTVVASDPDSGDPLSYVITAGNSGGAFQIDPGTGEISVADAAALDFETTPSWALTVEVQDAAGLTDTATVTVNLTDVAGTIAGTAYADEGVTTLGAGTTVRLLVNGVSVETALTAADGSYGFTSEVDAGDAALIFLDDDPTSQGTAVTVAGGADLSGVDLYADHVIVRSDDGGTLSNAEMAAALGGYVDSDILYSVPGGTLVVGGAGTDLYVASGHTFDPGGDVSTADLRLLGTMVGGASTITVAGDWDSTGGLFTCNTSTLVLGTSGQSSTLTTDPALAWWDATLNNVTIVSGSHVDLNTGTGFSRIKVLGLLDISGTLEVPGGQTLTLAYAQNRLNINPGGELTGAGVFERAVDDVPTHIVNQGTISVDTFQYGIRHWGVTPMPVTATTYGGDVIIKNWGSLDWDAVLGRAPGDTTSDLVVGGTLTLIHDRVGKTMSLDNSADDIDIHAGNLVIGDVGRNDVYSYFDGGAASITVTGDVTIAAADVPGSNVVDAGSSTWNVGGDWTNLDAFNAGTSTVAIGTSGQTSTITTPPTGLSAFNDVTINPGSTVTVSTLDTNGFQIHGLLTVSGTLDIPENIRIWERWGGTLDIDPGGELTGAGIFARDVEDDPNPIINDGTISVDSFVYQLRGWDDLIPEAVTATTYGNDLTIKNLGSVGRTGVLVGSSDLVVGGTLKIWDDRDGPTVVLDNTVNDIDITAGNLIVGDSTNIDAYGVFRTGSATINVLGDLTVEASDGVSGNNILDASDGTPTILVGGNWTNRDTFTAGTSSVILDGIGQSIAGSTTFHDLEKSVVSADVLRFEAGSTQTVQGLATLRGASGELLSMISDTPGSQWSFVLPAGASQAIDYVSVQDSDASGSDPAFLPLHPPDSVDAGNTLDWFNHAPLVDASGDMGLADIGEDPVAPSPAGETVAAIVASAGGDRITDPDAGALEGIAVVGVDDTNGTWQYSTDGGGSWNALGAVSDTSATLLDAAARVRFVPSSDYNGPAGDITFRAWDLFSGSSGDVGVDVSANGGLTPFSASVESATLGVLPVNDAPSLSGGSFSVLEYAPVGELAGSVSASDVDSGDVHSYSITAGNTGGAFTIDAATGDLRVADWTQLDPSVNPTFNLTVETRDAGGLTDTATVAIDVIPILYPEIPADPEPDADPPETVSTLPAAPSTSDDPEEGESDPESEVAPSEEESEAASSESTPGAVPHGPQGREAPPANAVTGTPMDLDRFIEQARGVAGRERGPLETGVSMKLTPLSAAQARLVASEQMLETLERMREEARRDIARAAEKQDLVVSTAEGVAVVFSGGVVAGMLRGSSLAAMGISSLPLWSRVDALAVLSLSEAELRKRREEIFAAEAEENLTERGVGDLLDREESR